MNILRHSIAELRSLDRPVHLAMGFFDGVHRGHRQVIASADTAGATRAVLTFEPHPLALFAPERQPALLTPDFEQKAALLEAAGAELLLVLPFTRELAALSPRAFLDTLRDTGKVVGFSVGRNWRFGAQGAGDAAYLMAYAAEHGLRAVINNLAESRGERICSSRIRELLAAGDLAAAAEMLGHPFSIAGRVEQGQHLARTLGFPTANIAVTQPAALPPFGVYAVETVIDGTGYRGVANLGLRPTIREAEKIVRLESHLFDFCGDLYGKHLTLALTRFIRPEQRFASVEELRGQIARDIAAAKSAAQG